MKSNAVQFKRTISEQGLNNYLKESLDIFSCNGLTIYEAIQGIDLSAGVFTHNAYEFIIPISCDIEIIVDDKKVTIAKNKLFPVNPEQQHGLINDINALKFMCIKIDKECIGEISKSIYGNAEIMFKNTSYKLQNELMILIQAFIQENKLRQTGYELAAKGLQYQIIVNLIRSTKNNMQKEGKNVLLYEGKRMLKAIEYINKNYDCEISLDDIANTAGLSKYHFIRVFKTYTGKTPNEYIIDLKIDKAKELLVNKESRITDICYQCGFNNLSYFTDSFKKKVGVSPSKFREFVGF